MEHRLYTFILNLIVFFCAMLPNTHAKTHVVRMLNSHKGQIMVFEPPVVKVAKGDEVLFKSVDAGHNSESFSIPKDADGWKSDISKDISVKFTKAGTYIYLCEPHIMMGMIGIIQVDNNRSKDTQVNLDKLSSRIFMNKERLELYRKQWEQLK